MCGLLKINMEMFGTGNEPVCNDLQVHQVVGGEKAG